MADSKGDRHVASCKVKTLHQDYGPCPETQQGSEWPLLTSHLRGTSYFIAAFLWL